MGTYYTNFATRKNIIDERKAPYGNDYGNIATVASCVRGNILWSVKELTVHATGKKSNWICCDRLVHSDSGWGYKPMDESVHPYYYSCPLKYLDMVPLGQSGTNAEWRYQVRAHAANVTNRKKDKNMYRRMRKRNQLVMGNPYS